jgi:rhamnulokinase
VGGGARNSLLCRLTAGATRRPVLAGPVEATALGNALVQAMAFGDLGSLADIRAVVRRSTTPRAFEPEDNADAWDEAYERFLRLVAATPDVGHGT